MTSSVIPIYTTFSQSGPFDTSFGLYKDNNDIIRAMLLSNDNYSIVLLDNQITYDDVLLNPKNYFGVFLGYAKNVNIIWPFLGRFSGPDDTIIIKIVKNNNVKNEITIKDINAIYVFGFYLCKSHLQDNNEIISYSNKYQEYNSESEYLRYNHIIPRLVESHYLYLIRRYNYIKAANMLFSNSLYENIFIIGYLAFMVRYYYDLGISTHFDKDIKKLIIETITEFNIYVSRLRNYNSVIGTHIYDDSQFNEKFTKNILYINDLLKFESRTNILSYPNELGELVIY